MKYPIRFTKNHAFLTLLLLTFFVVTNLAYSQESPNQSAANSPSALADIFTFSSIEDALEITQNAGFSVPLGSATRSIEAMVKTNDVTRTNFRENVFLSYGLVGTNQGLFNVGVVRGHLIIRIGSASYVDFPTRLNDNLWHHVLVEYTEGQSLRDISVTVDGVNFRNGRGNNEGNIPNTQAGPLTLGASVEGNYPFSGQLAEVSINGQAITADSVVDLPSDPISPDSPNSCDPGSQSGCSGTPANPENPSDSNFSYLTPHATLTMGTLMAPLVPDLEISGKSIKFSVEAPLPIGLNLSPTTGVISGTPSEEKAGKEYLVKMMKDGKVFSGTIWLEVQPALAAAAGQYFMALDGNDSNAGTIDQPFKTIKKAVSVLRPGDTLFIRGGEYIGFYDLATNQKTLEIRNVIGTSAQPITIQAYPGEKVLFDAALPQFRTLNNDDWERVEDVPAGQRDSSEMHPHPDEYRSKLPILLPGLYRGYQNIGKGYFLDRAAYTLLLAYSNVNDFRADNEKFGRIDVTSAIPSYCENYTPDVNGPPRPRDSRPECQPCVDNDSRAECFTCSNRDPLAGPCPIINKRSFPFHTFRYPWTYYGPGLWWNKETNRLHIRLSHTHNGIAELEDYSGPTDPGQVRLGISPSAAVVMHIGSNQSLVIKDLSFRGGGGGGEFQGMVGQNTNLTFDHVNFYAGEYSFRFNHNHGLKIFNSRFDGGMPPWSFRGEFKDNYDYLDANGVVKTNNQVRGSSRSLFGLVEDEATEIAYTEFVNAHDIYIGGIRTNFHHNYIDNIHDDALFMGGSIEARVHHNYLRRVLSVVNFAVAGNNPESPNYIYRNLFDFREPTAGYRPGPNGDLRTPWRYALLFKYNYPVANHHFYQNTVVSVSPSAAFNQWSDIPTRPDQLRFERSTFNNIFVSYNGEASFGYMPQDPYVQLRTPENEPYYRSNGNLWYRPTNPAKPLFQCVGHCQSATYNRSWAYFTFDDLLSNSALMRENFESQSLFALPQFVHLQDDGVPTSEDNFRLQSGSPGIGAGVMLPSDLIDPDATGVSRPDIGAFQSGQEPMRVGVDGRFVY